MENPLDWYTEAKCMIYSERSLLNHISISSLTVSDGVYLNIETLENKRFCVLLNKHGFRIVAKAFDQDTNYSQFSYETHFALLTDISKRYCQRFYELISVQLNNIAGSRNDTDN